MSIFINPGTGQVPTGSREQSEINIKKFIEDLGIEAKYRFITISCDGRHVYKVKTDECTHEIDMPSIPLNEVRYLGEEGQNIWDFPRLYVDGSSWVWKYALDVCFNED